MGEVGDQVDKIEFGFQEKIDEMGTAISDSVNNSNSGDSNFDGINNGGGMTPPDAIDTGTPTDLDSQQDQVQLSQLRSLARQINQIPYPKLDSYRATIGSNSRGDRIVEFKITTHLDDLKTGAGAVIDSKDGSVYNAIDIVIPLSEPSQAVSVAE